MGRLVLAQMSDRRDLIPGGRDLRDRTEVLLAEEDRAVGTPVATTTVDIVREGLSVTAQRR